MNDWSGIPNAKGGKSTPTRTASSLPAPGSTVVATVEEDLGEGMYSLRWAGQRINVSSRTPLQQGQGLLLKSETSPEGRPRLVVQGPAPQTPAIEGRVIYGPGIARRQPGQADTSETSSQDTPEQPADTDGRHLASRPQGIFVNTSATATSAMTGAMPDGRLTAAVAAADIIGSPDTVGSMVGEILEPLPDSEGWGEMLLRETEQEIVSSRKGEQSEADDRAPVSNEETDAEHAGAGDARPATQTTGKTHAPVSSPFPPSPVSPSLSPAGNSRVDAGIITIGSQSSDSRASATSPLRHDAGAASVPSGDGGEADRPDANASVRSTPQQTENFADAVKSAAADKSEVKPEMLFKEALNQMVKAAELPLGSPSAGAATLGAGGGGPMPEAVLDKAAAILLRGAGLTPDPETIEAAKALMGENAPVDRESVRAILAAAAGIEDGAERQDAIKASARLLARDIPVSPPLVSGLADVIGRRGGVHQLLNDAAASLVPDPGVPETAPLLDGARQLLELMQVDLDSSDAAAALERYMSSFGREALGKALALVETAAQAALERNPALQRIDEALAVILTELRDDLEQFAVAASPDAAGARPAVVIDLPKGAPVVVEPAAPEPADRAAAKPGAPEQPVVMESDMAKPAVTEQIVPEPVDPVPLPVRPGAPINAYLNAPRALPIEEMLQNLPPMPKVVSLGAASAIFAAGQTAAVGGLIEALPGTAGQEAEGNAAEESTVDGTLPQKGAAGEMAKGETSSGLMMKLDRLFQTPGLNRPELLLLRPGGFLDSYLARVADGAESGGGGTDAARLLRELMSENPVEAAKARQELPQKDAAELKDLAARLTKIEAEAVRSDPLLTRLADAASSLRDLGRQLLAVKAENLAGQERSPGVMLAEVPFKLGDDAGEGRMQMFYRRGKNRGDGWTSRVILDLNTTSMGPVLGDMRFFGQDMMLNMFVENAGAADHLAAAADELADALRDKGFRLKSKFMVLPPPPPAPTPAAERPDIADGGEAGGAAVRSAVPGRLDIRT